jgi:ComF family protein
MNFASSAITRRLSNWGRIFFNSCVRFTHGALPQHCLLCTASAPAQPLCYDCYAHLPWLPAARCPQCAVPTPAGNTCGTCLSHPPRFDAVTAAFAYDWPLSTLIHHYKYAGNLALARPLANALGTRITTPVDLIVPMPLAP